MHFLADCRAKARLFDACVSACLLGSTIPQMNSPALCARELKHHAAAVPTLSALISTPFVVEVAKILSNESGSPSVPGCAGAGNKRREAHAPAAPAAKRARGSPDPDKQGAAETLRT